MKTRLLTARPPAAPAQNSEPTAPRSTAPAQDPAARTAPPTRRARGLIWTLTAVFILGWLAVSGVGGPYFGKIGEVSTNDQSSFLPRSAESTRASDWVERFSDSSGPPAIIVAERPSTSSPSDARAADALEEITERAQDAGIVDEASPPVPSDDERAYEVIAPIVSEDAGEGVETLRAIIADADVEGMTVQVTGPAAFTADLVEAFQGIDGLLLLVAVGAVFAILVVVYRSPLLPIVVLLTSVSALSAAIFVIWHLASAGVLPINGQVQGILFILVVGATTDYSLLYVARFRDALAVPGVGRARATLTALRGAWEPILASGGTVIAGLLCLLTSDLSSTRALGPVAAIGLVIAIAAALTFLPAMLALLGRAAFFPFAPKPGRGTAALGVDPAVDPGSRAQRVEGRGLWASIARLVAAHPRRVWLGALIILIIPALWAPRFSADGVSQADLVLGQSQTRDGQATLEKHFPGGSGSPLQIVVDAAEQRPVARALQRLDTVESLTVTSAEMKSGSASFESDGRLTKVPEQATDRTPTATASDAGPGARRGPPKTVTPKPTTVEGRVLLQATLAQDPNSPEAWDSVAQVRDVVHAEDPDALVGGPSAVALDSNDTAERDRTIAIPLILAVITLILMLLLRSVLAPVLLVGLTVVSFATALGTSALVFQHVLGLPDADPSVPLYAFVFLVALGIDYNIFLMSRVREEAVRVGTRPGVLLGLMRTGGVITSAGIVLAATFAALAVLPIMFLVQLAFIVAFGVLLDAILVRSFLVPGLFYDIGRASWWPFARRIR
ncbi:MMPL family transporter [Brevibacterium sp. BRM-1]|uniref:MMPL family transporter n=1 Tax=Brevibacterium sp. BRM-1 TaxID=2999062 RepID=UPI0022831ECE|nr:MMPL family transporter [Brevibacterium sp. BRM-1]WAL39866.1 MMPL family transporter [Brevibacterium sp. BRM-1]